ncbi:MAG: chromosomal replication initiator protein DnaA [Oscillospiraceae bacterium]|nr:chromosomal replication initiator protein DnaA [Oscillospiraceae bacterium]
MNNISDTWLVVKDILREKMSRTSVETWFGDSRAIELRGSEFYIFTPTPFVKETIEKHYLETAALALNEVYPGRGIRLRLLNESELEFFHNAPNIKKTRSYRDRFTFDNFIVGRSNEFAHAAALAVANERNFNYNPLFIYGDPGLGKTHLLYAISHVMKNSHPEYNIVYIRGDDFLNEMVKSIQQGKTDEFRSKYRGTDLLLVDDVQFIAGKEQTQIEFFHTFNALLENDKYIVLTSDRPPRDILTLVDRLKSRFEGGITAEITAPNLETRIAIVQQKAEQFGLQLKPDVTEYIAENITTNVRLIEGVIKKIHAQSTLFADDGFDSSSIREITESIIRSEKSNCTPELIISKTAAFFTINTDSILSKSRDKKISLARKIAMHLIRAMTDESLATIGKVFGYKDHTTVLYSIRDIDSRIPNDPELVDTMRDIRNNIMTAITDVS